MLSIILAIFITLVVVALDYTSDYLFNGEDERHYISKSTPECIIKDTSTLNNVAFGHNALFNCTTGNSNIALGYSAGPAIRSTPTCNKIACEYNINGERCTLGVNRACSSSEARVVEKLLDTDYHKSEGFTDKEILEAIKLTRGMGL